MGKHRGNQDTDQDVMTVAQLAHYLDLAPITVYRLVNGDPPEIPCWRVGKQWRFSRRAIDAKLKGDGPRVRAVPALAHGATA